MPPTILEITCPKTNREDAKQKDETGRRLFCPSILGPFVNVLGSTLFWANYSDLKRGHPKWWFGRGKMSPKKARNIQV